MNHLRIAVLYTLITAVLLGLVYPLFITAVAQLTMRARADGQLITRNGQVVGSELIGQPFSGPGYFHSRPSNAGSGYDAANSSGSNYGPTNKALVDRVAAGVKAEETGAPVPVDLVTASASGLDPDITPAAALYQVPRIARERRMSPSAVKALIGRDMEDRQFGLLGEPQVNVLLLNLDLDRAAGH